MIDDMNSKRILSRQIYAWLVNNPNFTWDNKRHQERLLQKMSYCK